MHRLVHRRVRANVEADRWIEVRRRGAECVAEWLFETVDPAMLAEVELQRAHIDEALLAAEQSGSDDVATVIVNRLATHLQHRALFAEARPLFELALVRAEVTGPRELATALSNLALLLRDMGHLAEARPLLERSLALVETEYGPDHPKVAARLTNLATVLKALGKASEARELLVRALAIDEGALGAAHFKVATILTTLATVLQDLGDAPAALPLLDRALAIEEKSHGEDHPRVATPLWNLAFVTRDLGRSNEACSLLERALAIDVATYGDEHPRSKATRARLDLVRQESREPGAALDGAGVRPPVRVNAWQEKKAVERDVETATNTNMTAVRQNDDLSNPCFSPGVVLCGSYRIIRRLQHDHLGGGLVVVHLRTGRGFVAAPLGDDSTARQLGDLMREELQGEVSAGSKHVVRALDVVEDDRCGVLVILDLPEGDFVAARLAERGRMEFEEVHPIIEQVWLGLAELHAAHLKVGQLTPANVFVADQLGGDPCVKIVRNSLWGGPWEPPDFHYWAPEFAARPSLAGPPADVYTCATLIYRMISGELPYRIMGQFNPREPAPRAFADVLGHAIDPRLEALIVRGLAREPSARFQTAVEALTAWRALLR